MNEQEKFWLGNFGNNYISRNNSKKLQYNNDHFFKKMRSLGVKEFDVFQRPHVPLSPGPC